MKRIVISVIGIFLISFLFHSIYDLFPNFFTSLLFPVNESVWEHNKMIFLSYITWMFVLLIFYNKRKLNVIWSTLIGGVLCIILMNIIFTPIYLYVFKTEHNFIFTMIVYLISIIGSLIVVNYLLKQKYNYNKERLGVVFIIIIFIIFGYFTYYPITSELMYDFNERGYGIVK